MSKTTSHLRTLAGNRREIQKRLDLLNEEITEEITACRNAKISWARIAEAMNDHRGTVHKWYMQRVSRPK